jgi:hypothetical protein
MGGGSLPRCSGTAGWSGLTILAIGTILVVGSREDLARDAALNGEHLRVVGKGRCGLSPPFFGMGGRPRSSRKHTGAILALLVSVALSRWSATSAEGGLYSSVTDRFGVDVRLETGHITDYDVGTLNIGWYSDWSTNLDPPRPGGVEYAQLVWVTEGVVSPATADLGAIVDANPGALWLIGNEPECIWQGRNSPQQYAEAYYRVHTFITGRDPTARIAIGGVVQPTPLRLKWLDQVLEHYQANYGQRMPVDVWNIHNMILPEVRGEWGCDIPVGLNEDVGRRYDVDDNDSLDIFQQHVLDFRRWMMEQGERDKPLIITEYGVLMPVSHGLTVERVNAFMDGTFDYLLSARDQDMGCSADEYRLVQRWMWFSLNDQPYVPETGEGFNGALFDYQHSQYPGVLTEYGVNFQRYTRALLNVRRTIYLPAVAVRFGR